MSDKKAAEEFQLPDTSESAGLLDQLYAEAFFGKMAEFGIAPQTEEGAQAMLETAYQLDMVDDAPAIKEAQVAADPFVDANMKLAHVLSQSGINTDAQVDVEQHNLDTIKQASFALSQDSDLYKAVLAVKAAEADAESIDQGGN